MARNIKSMLSKYGLAGVNKPKRTPSHKTKSHMVLAKEGNKVKLVRFGLQGAKTAGSNPKTEAMKKKRKSFRARHKCDQKKSKLGAQYWACKHKW